MPEKINFVRCPKGHTTPMTPQFYAKKPVEEKDADGMPMYADGLFCSVCQISYSLDELKDAEGDERELINRHNLEVMFSG